uniref:NR LBD domain-containing protein n=1 Tax=Acrobeloides nanus TaxID=290746 RepID=A0A914E0J6_9BILA
MLNLRLTQFEVVYILAQILWSIQDIKGLASTTHDLANQMVDQISSELHDYYVNERRMYNYSPRLVKMTKLVEGSRAMVNELQNVTLISQVYNIFDFKADLSELCDPC